MENLKKEKKHINQSFMSYLNANIKSVKVEMKVYPLLRKQFAYS